MSTTFQYVDVEEATAKIVIPNGSPVRIVGTQEIRNGMDETSFAQICNIATAPGVEEFVVNPDFHVGYGTIVGSVFASSDHVYPCAVGPDVKCSMSFLMLDIFASALQDKKVRRMIIDALEERIPLGPGGHQASKARHIDMPLLHKVAIEGASKDVLSALGLPLEWQNYCEDYSHGHDGHCDLESHLKDRIRSAPALEAKLTQLGGVGGGNHFMEGSVVSIQPGMEAVAASFGLKNGHVGFLNHFGSRGFGYMLTEGGRGWKGQFRHLAEHFDRWHIPYPGKDKHNVYCPEGTPEFVEYMNDMYLAANFATVNHLLVCKYVLEAIQSVLGNGTTGRLVYYIAHNIIRREVIDKAPMWVHRKGATRALWAGHHELKDTPFYETGHPILLPGNPIDGSTIMVGQRGSRKALNSVNHGAGRRLRRTKAREAFIQKNVNAHFDAADILTNCRDYPLDEASGAYKEYAPVIKSVELAGLAKTVARLKPMILLKDSDKRPETSA